MKTISTLLLMLKLFLVFGQTADSTNQDQFIIDYIGDAPSFPGGHEALKKYLERNLKWSQGQVTIEGKVFVEFWVEANGAIMNIQIIRGLCDTCDSEAMRLVSEMPKWIPAKQNEKPIRTWMVLPIAFDL